MTTETASKIIGLLVTHPENTGDKRDAGDPLYNYYSVIGKVY